MNPILTKQSGIRSRLLKRLGSITGFGTKRRIEPLRRRLLQQIADARAPKLRADDIPSVFYHGAPDNAVDAIRREGLKPGVLRSRHTTSSSNPTADYRGTHIFLSKDPTYASGYAKVNAGGFYDQSQKHQDGLFAAVLPQHERQKVKRMFELKNRSFLEPYGADEHAGVGKFTVRGALNSMGTEYVYPGSIPNKFITQGSPRGLQADLINEVLQGRAGGLADKMQRLKQLEAMAVDAGKRSRNTISALFGSGLTATGVGGFITGRKRDD
jgi:hypothetical protein